MESGAMQSDQVTPEDDDSLPTMVIADQAKPVTNMNKDMEKDMMEKDMMEKDMMEKDMNSTEPLSEQEAAVYDRQIRVWGFEAQKRLRGARLLAIGCTGVVAEACKNVVLAGLGSVNLLDDTPMSFDVASSNLLVPGGGVLLGSQPSSAGYHSTSPPPSPPPPPPPPTPTMAQICGPNLQELNPMVRVSVEPGRFEDKDEDFLSRFDVVVLGRAPIDLQKRVNALCRRQKKGRVAFYTVDCRGMSGKIFCDLQTHQFAAKGRETDGLRTESFVSIEDAISIPWQKYPKRTHKLMYAIQVIEEFERRGSRQPGELTKEDLSAIYSLRDEMAKAQGVPPESTVDDNILERIVMAGKSEMPAVCAILGGILGQELMRCVSAIGLPINNFFLYDAVLGDGVIERMIPEEGGGEEEKGGKK